MATRSGENASSKNLNKAWSDSVRTAQALVARCQKAQRRAEDLAGLADQCGAVHDRRILGVGAGDADAYRLRSSEQRVDVRARGMSLDQHFALEGVTSDHVAAGVEQVGVTAQDLAILKHDHP